MNREHVSHANLVGRLGQKPELGETTEGVKYARLSIATSERYTDRGGQDPREQPNGRAPSPGATWPRRSRPSFDKGDSVSLTGSLRVNSYEKDGAKNRVLELHVDKAEPALDPQLSMNEARLVGVVRSVESKTSRQRRPP